MNMSLFSTAGPGGPYGPHDSAPYARAFCELSRSAGTPGTARTSPRNPRPFGVSAERQKIREGGYSGANRTMEAAHDLP